jgi:hypothetical protein
LRAQGGLARKRASSIVLLLVETDLHFVRTLCAL